MERLRTLPTAREGATGIRSRWSDSKVCPQALCRAEEDTVWDATEWCAGVWLSLSCPGAAQTLLLWEALLEAPQANLGLHLLSPYLALCLPPPRLLSIFHHECCLLSLFPKSQSPEPFIKEADSAGHSEALLFKNLWLCISNPPSPPPPPRWFFGWIQVEETSRCTMIAWTGVFLSVISGQGLKQSSLWCIGTEWMDRRETLRVHEGFWVHSIGPNAYSLHSSKSTFIHPAQVST